MITREATDEAWFGFRRAWYGDDLEQLAEMERLSQHLLSIPGVRLPTSPSALANAAPARRFG